MATWPCWNSKPSSCQRKCARKLKCGNHKCSLVCHSVSHPQDMQQQAGCANCEEGCAVPRPAGCVHACPKGCHPPPCTPCNFVIKSKCHCGLNQSVYKCSEYFDETGTVQEIIERREKLRSCGNRCLKNVSFILENKYCINCIIPSFFSTIVDIAAQPFATRESVLIPSYAARRFAFSAPASVLSKK